MSEEDDIEDLHRVHKLAELLEQPVFTPELQRVLQAGSDHLKKQVEEKAQRQ